MLRARSADKSHAVSSIIVMLPCFHRGRGVRWVNAPEDYAKKNVSIEIEESSGNVLADLGMPDADELLAKAQGSR